MKLKKVFALAMTACMGISLLSGCGKSDSGSKAAAGGEKVINPTFGILKRKN